MSAAVSYIVFLPNARGGCTEAIVRVTFAARDRRIFGACEYITIDVDMTRIADLSLSEAQEILAFCAAII